MLFVITVHDYNIQRDLITTTIEKRLLARHNEQLKQYLQSMQDAIVIRSCQDKKIEFINEAMSSIILDDDMQTPLI